jgi:hypothetical protein
MVVDDDGLIYITGGTSGSFFEMSGGYDTSFNGDHDAFVICLDALGNLVWGTYIGGSAFDKAYDIEIDNSGNIYVVGETRSTDFPWDEEFGENLQSYRDAFVVVLNQTGTRLLHSAILGGSGYDLASGVAIDYKGDVYVTGWTDSFNIVTKNAIQDEKGGERDGFIYKISSSWSRLMYATYYGGTDFDLPYSIRVDSKGRVHICGVTHSKDLLTFNPITNRGAGTTDGFLLTISENGTTVEFASYLGGREMDQINALILDSEDSLYVVGTTSSSNFPTAIAYNSTKSGTTDDDCFVSKIETDTFELVCSTYFGGSGTDHANSFVIDEYGTAYVVGESASQDLPMTPGVEFDENSGALDIILFKLGDGSDSDSDSIPDYMESAYHSDRFSNDSDNDSMLDPYEIENGLLPSVDDASGDLDGDGLSNALEFELGTLANEIDSDSDGYPDYWEYSYGFDPVDPSFNLIEFIIGSSGVIILGFGCVLVVVFIFFVKRGMDSQLMKKAAAAEEDEIKDAIEELTPAEE